MNHSSRETILATIQTAQDSLSHSLQFSSNETTKSTNSSLTTSLNDQSTGFEDCIKSLIAFIENFNEDKLVLPSSLSSRQRLVVHQLATKLNLSHHSEGFGNSRKLILKKDELFHQINSNKSFKPVIDELLSLIEKNKPTHPSDRSSDDSLTTSLLTLPLGNGSSYKESKYHLRRVRSLRDEPNDGEIGSYENSAASSALRRLEKVTDAYASSVDIGWTPEELKTRDLELIEAVHSPWIDRILKGPESNRKLSSTFDISSSTKHAAKSSPLISSNAVSSSSKENFEEQCLSCYTTLHVDYPVDQWICRGYCSTCNEETIWRLVRLPIPHSDSPMPSWEDDNGTSKDKNLNVEEILPYDEVHNQTPEDILEMADLNGFSAEQVSWLDAFLTYYHEKRTIRKFQANQSDSLDSNTMDRNTTIGERPHVIFCIQFEDLLHTPIWLKESQRKSSEAQRFASLTKEHPEQDVLYIWLCENKLQGFRFDYMINEIVRTLVKFDNSKNQITGRDEDNIKLDDRYGDMFIAFQNNADESNIGNTSCILQLNNSFLFNDPKLIPSLVNKYYNCIKFGCKLEDIFPNHSSSENHLSSE